MSALRFDPKYLYPSADFITIITVICLMIFYFLFFLLFSLTVIFYTIKSIFFISSLNLFSVIYTNGYFILIIKIQYYQCFVITKVVIVLFILVGSCILVYSFFLSTFLSFGSTQCSRLILHLPFPAAESLGQRYFFIEVCD